MKYRKASVFLAMSRGAAALLLLAVSAFLSSTADAQKAKAAAPKAAAPKSAPAKTSTPAAAHTNTSASGSHTTAPGHTSSPGGHSPEPSKTASVKAPPGGSVKSTTKGTVAKDSSGRTTAFKGNNGHEAKFDSKGGVKEVHANGVTVRKGPGGVRRTEVERADHSRVVAYGHGQGYIQHPYSYGGRSYYSRSYYYDGGYYNAYYHPYYYGNVYLNGYMPAYYYPPVYYGWAYNPWPAPVAYGWGWGASPWVGYYGAYFQPYPVYPSAAFWIVDCMVAASLAEAYAVAAAADTAKVPEINPARLVYASYDPATGTTSPTMTKEVKDAVADEIKLELAAQKAANPADGSSGSLVTLLADQKPHVFVAAAALTVTSSGTDCGLTEGDVLATTTTPAKDATAADLRVLASKQTDCAKGNVVSVEITDLQEMHNHLLSNIDKGMAEMKDHPGKGGLPAPPAEAIAGTKQAPYAAAAPAADPNGAADINQAAKQGADTEREVAAEARDDSGGDTASAAAQSPIGGVAPPAPAPATPKGPSVIALGQTPEEVIASKGQPTSKASFPTKMIFIYPDMKITFKNGKLVDVN